MGVLRRWAWLGFTLGGVACGQGESQPSGYVLIDSDARTVGFAIERDDSSSPATLPVALGDGEQVALVRGDSRRPLSATPGEVIIVRGADADTERWVLGQDIEPDMLDLDAPQTVASEFAGALGGELTARGSSWRLLATDAWELASQMPVPAELYSVRPVAMGVTTTTKQAVSSGTEPIPTPASSADAPSGASPSEPATAPYSTAVAGTWRGQFFSEMHAAWYEFTVTLTESNGNLSGQIVADTWSGSPDSPAKPTRCTGGERWTVREPARGTLNDDGMIEFDGQSWAVESRICGGAPVAYAVDHFSGKLSADGSQWNAQIHDHVVLMPAFPLVLRRLNR